MSLFWRVTLLNASVLLIATVLLLFAPVTVSAPVRLSEAVVLVAGLVALLAANVVVLRAGLGPLERLTRLMTRIDLLHPGERLPVAGSSEVAALIETFNAMLGRLERERGASAARALSAQEGERRRIAQELHDEIGQSLTAVLLELKRAGDRASEPMRTDLRHAQETVRDSLDEVRRIARRLRPGVLDDLGLTAALTALSSEFAVQTGLRIRRSFAADLPRLSSDAELVLYRVAQESLTNTARHADARHVDILLTRHAGEVELRIRDDGRGILGFEEGAGIRGMRERALLVDARLTIGPGPTGGTEVLLHVPIHPGQPAETFASRR